MAAINMTTLDIHDPLYDPELDRRNRFKFNPNEVAALCFLASFGVLTLFHIFLTINSRIWWLMATAVGGGGEIAGWVGRYLGSQNPRLLTPYLLQQVCLAISPVFFSATCYGIFTKLVFVVDPKLSRVNPKYYTPIFVFWDVATLIVQAIGGGQSGAAASATDSGAGARAERGGHIYLGGVATQLLVMIGFSIIGLDYIRRVRNSDIPSHRWQSPAGRRIKLLMWGVIFASILIMIRNVFRTVELAEGYYGYLAIHEVYFAVLDALPIALTMIVLLLTHPAFTLTMVKPGEFLEKEPLPADSESEFKVKRWTSRDLAYSNSRQSPTHRW